MVIATKAFFPVQENVSIQDINVGQAIKFANGIGLSRKHIFDNIDASLKRLEIDYIDPYIIHRFGPVRFYQNITIQGDSKNSSCDL